MPVTDPCDGRARAGRRDSRQVSSGASAVVFDLRPEIAAFRAEVRAFCREELPAELAAKVRAHRWLDKGERERWQRILYRRGWAAGHWPRAWGGLDWSPLQRFVFNEELERAGAPWLTPFGINYVGPILLAHGSDAQRERHLPSILRSEVWWCQGYSEPGAGSDLAGLATRAERRGDRYVVNGQKTWTTMAQWADWMFCLVRTARGERPQHGISLLLIDLRTPGITIRPIATMDECHHVNEVFFADVEVPLANLVGEEGEAWGYTKVFLTHERILATELGKADRLLADVAALAARVFEAGAPLASGAGFRRRRAALGVRRDALEALAYDALDRFERGEEPAVEAAALKIRGSELQQAISELAVDVLAHAGLGYDTGSIMDAAADEDLRRAETGWLFEHFYGRAFTIYGGTNEIQRAIIARQALGL
ncbi:MAG: acyl-CoA dehydrogenase family protein [Gammaproteobacteria bacterium]|nr:acyl-CoA dehydrogenase family protein [Gammaproteobacteria bacterium]